MILPVCDPWQSMTDIDRNHIKDTCFAATKDDDEDYQLRRSSILAMDTINISLCTSTSPFCYSEALKHIWRSSLDVTRRKQF